MAQRDTLSRKDSHSSSALCGVDDFVSDTYDYIIIGGGTAGLCIAARLTENPDVRVGVLEAGESRMDDPRVLTPSLFVTLPGDKNYDWMMETTPQPSAGNKVYSVPRGKLLGGSSGINYLMYVRGSKGDYDGWESMGNKGWGWDGLLPYFRKHQTLDLGNNPIIEGADKRTMPHGGKDKYHGSDGPIHTSFNDFRMPMEDDFIKGCYEVTGKENTLHDAYSGDHYGFYSSLGAVDRTGNKGTRSYAASGYLKPNLNRPNLRVLTSALVEKINLDSSSGAPKATGVKFSYDGQTYNVNARSEVVLSAGVIQSPQILELSGVGNPDVLKKANIPLQVENRSVGANFQDHVLGGVIYECQDGHLSLDHLSDDVYGKQQQEIYDNDKLGPYGSPGMCMGFVSYASLVSKEELQETIDLVRKSSKATTAFEKAQEEVLIKQLSDPTFANMQTFFIPANMDMTAGGDQTKFLGPAPKGKNHVSLLICLEHPFSRGTVHAISSDPRKSPQIDPGYFENPADVKILAAGLKWLDDVCNSKALSKGLGKRVQPAPEVSLKTEEDRIEVLRNHISTQYHLIGTSALGDVVDNDLKVKGVDRLRVIDASIFPGHVSGNIMASTYAVAEKGADILKASIKA